MAEAGLWWEWIMGMLVIVWDALSQRISSVTLPPRIPISSLSHLTRVITSCAPLKPRLAESGVHVTFAVADTDAARELIVTWEGEHVDNVPPPNCEVMDCLSLDSWRKFAVNWEARGLPLNVLINVAGTFCMDGLQRVSKDGFEQHMQVNHLAPALLKLLLLPFLLRGSPSQVVMVNSVLLFSNLLQRRLPKEAGVDIICVHPGQVTREVAAGAGGIVRFAQKLPFYLLSPVEGVLRLAHVIQNHLLASGAQTQVFLTTTACSWHPNETSAMHCNYLNRHYQPLQRTPASTNWSIYYQSRRQTPLGTPRC